MSTWTAVIVATQGRADFWKHARAEGVEPLQDPPELPELALIEVITGNDMDAPLELAKVLSTTLGTAAIGFVAQTGADTYDIRAYDQGECMRKLVYSRDDGGWLVADGIVQPWEPAFFFDGEARPGDAPDAHWPDMLDDGTSELEIARYEQARKARDATRVMKLLHPRSTAPLHRLCKFYRVDPNKPIARWEKPSFWSRLFG
jgi:hypothetical protein